MKIINYKDSKRLRKRVRGIFVDQKKKEGFKGSNRPLNYKNCDNLNVTEPRRG